MPNYIASITVDNVIKALGDFIKTLLPAGDPPPVPVIRAEVNRVAPPYDQFVELTELLELDLSVPAMNYANIVNQTAEIDASTRIDVQIDFYGEDSGDFAKAFKSAFRSSWGYDQFPVTVKPLYTSDGMQTPLVTGEEQYERRWTLTASLQYNPSVTVPQQSATTATAIIKQPANFPTT